MKKEPNRPSRHGVWSVCLLAILAGSLAVAEDESITLKGLVEPAEYDDDGNVTAVTVYDDAWGSVLVMNEGKGKALLKHIGATVEVTGTIVELDGNSDYMYAIDVASYKVLEAPEPDDDPDWDPEE